MLLIDSNVGTLPNFWPLYVTEKRPPIEWLGADLYPNNREEGEIKLFGEPEGMVSEDARRRFFQGKLDLPWKETAWKIAEHPSLKHLEIYEPTEQVRMIYKKPFQMRLALYKAGYLSEKHRMDISATVHAANRELSSIILR